MSSLLDLFWLFLRVNLLTTSGPASVGLLFQETVGTMMTRAEFVEAVSFSSFLPGSDAIQLAMFIGYAVHKLPGALVALLGTIIPPTILMAVGISILHKLHKEGWMIRFVTGLIPAISIIMGFVAFQLLVNDSPSGLGWKPILIALGAWLSLHYKIPAPLVLLAAGIAGVLIF